VIEVHALADTIQQLPAGDHGRLIEAIRQLARMAGLETALRTLFRQQVNAGYVLFDPLAPDLLSEKSLPTSSPQITLTLQWNPQRELRLNHHLLLERGVIAKDIDQSKLINRNAAGLACYLCPHNIALQSPSETCLPLVLNNEPYVLGANFAPITDNHFTVIPHMHRSQHYHPGVLQAGFDLVIASNGAFRALFNGRAGASILEHEHLHASDTRLPIEMLDSSTVSTRYREGAATVSQPDYPLPLWLIEGNELAAVIDLGHRLITAWQALNPQRHSENLLMTRRGGHYRLFVIPRDLARLTAPERTAAMGSFEAAGLIVLSRPSDRALFDQADQASAYQLLASLTPEQSVQQAFLVATKR
jgi:hypothetical protein